MNKNRSKKKIAILELLMVLIFLIGVSGCGTHKKATSNNEEIALKASEHNNKKDSYEESSDSEEDESESSNSSEEESEKEINGESESNNVETESDKDNEVGSTEKTEETVTPKTKLDEKPNTATSEAVAKSPYGSTNRNQNTNKESETESNGNVTNSYPIGSDGKIDSKSGPVIGDTISRKYHLPYQKNFKINKSNAIRFSSEAEAVSAGYVKSKK